MKHAVALAALTFCGLTTQAQEIQGQLTSDDLLRDNEYHYDIHNVKVSSPSMLQVALNSDDFDAYLIVKTPDGLELTNDDHEGNNSYIEVIAEKPGTYEIWASTYGEGSVGNYSLVVDKSTGLNIDRTEGRLDPRDTQLPKGEYIDVYKRTFSGNQNFTVRLVCYGFDGFLVVTSPSGQVYRNDDAEDVSVSRISDLVPMPGEWTIQITSAAVEEVGAYDLELITFK